MGYHERSVSAGDPAANLQMMMMMHQQLLQQQGARSNSDLLVRPFADTSRISSFSSGDGCYSSASMDASDWAAFEDGFAAAGVGGGGFPSHKRVIVVVDQSREARIAMLWALSHVVHKADTLTLLHVLPNPKTPQGKAMALHSSDVESWESGDMRTPSMRPGVEPKAQELANSMKLLCSTRRPGIDVEVVVLEGDKGPTIVDHAKKLLASILVLGQRKPSFFRRLFTRNSYDPLVEYCIENAECLTLAVRKKSKKAGGYLINSRWHRNFWLLA